MLILRSAHHKQISFASLVYIPFALNLSKGERKEKETPAVSIGRLDRGCQGSQTRNRLTVLSHPSTILASPFDKGGRRGIYALQIRMLNKGRTNHDQSCGTR